MVKLISLMKKIINFKIIKKNNMLDINNKKDQEKIINFLKNSYKEENLSDFDFTELKNFSFQELIEFLIIFDESDKENYINHPRLEMVFLCFTIDKITDQLTEYDQIKFFLKRFSDFYKNKFIELMFKKINLSLSLEELEDCLKLFITEKEKIIFLKQMHMHIKIEKTKPENLEKIKNLFTIPIYQRELKKILIKIIEKQKSDNFTPSTRMNYIRIKNDSRLIPKKKNNLII